MFDEHRLDLICDDDERIRAIFLHRGDAERFSEVPFSFNRAQVVERFGPPSKTGGPVRLPVLGEHGAWDRFSRHGAVIHVQYGLVHDEIEMVTLMRPDAAP